MKKLHKELIALCNVSGPFNMFSAVLAKMLYFCPYDIIKEAAAAPLKI